MDWYKVKVSHTLYDNMDDRDFHAWHKLMALTAQLEKMPTNEQILTVCTQKRYEKLSEFFRKYDRSLSEILQKVLEDATEVCKKREYFKIKKRQEREKIQNVNLTSQSSSLTVNPHIRLEKIRLDNSIVNTEEDSVFIHFSKNIHTITPTIQSEIQSYFIDTPKDWIIEAINEASQHNKMSWAYVETVLKAWKQKGCISKEKKKNVRDMTFEEKQALLKLSEGRNRNE